MAKAKTEPGESGTCGRDDLREWRCSRQGGGDRLGGGRPLTRRVPSIPPGTATASHPFRVSHWRGTASSYGPASPEGPDTEAVSSPEPPGVPTPAGPGGETRWEEVGADSALKKLFRRFSWWLFCCALSFQRKRGDQGEDPPFAGPSAWLHVPLFWSLLELPRPALRQAHLEGRGSPWNAGLSPGSAARAGAWGQEKRSGEG